MLFLIGFIVVVFNFEEFKNWKKKVLEYCLLWKIVYLDISNKRYFIKEELIIFFKIGNKKNRMWISLGIYDFFCK